MKIISFAAAAALSAFVAGAAQAQTFKTIRVLGAGDPSLPWGPLTLGPNGTFYGVSLGGGLNNAETIVRVTTRGSVSIAHAFSASEPAPQALMFGPDGNLFVTSGLFQPREGRLSRLSPDGTRFATLRVFDPNVELMPAPEPLTIGNDGNLYGLVRDFDVWNSFRLSPAGSYTLLASYSSAPTMPQFAIGLSTGLDGNMYAISIHGGDFNQGTFFRLGTDGAVTVLHSFTPDEGSPTTLFVVDRNTGDFYGLVQKTGASPRLLRITTSGAVSRQLVCPGTFVLGQDPPPVLGVDGNYYGTMELGNAPSVSAGTMYRLTPSGDFTVMHQFVDLADGVGPQGLTMGADGLLYGVTNETLPSPVVGGSGGGTVYKLGLPWALAFDAGDATVPWRFPDWQYGEYKAECPFPGSLPVGLSVSPTWAGASAGAAHSVLCKEPLAQVTPNPFGYFQARAGEALSVNENVETFYDHDSTHVGSRSLPQFANNDWDQGHYKGECPAGAFVTGIAQTGDWDAPTDSGVGTKPHRTVDHILCSRTRCDSPSGPYTAGNNCTTRALPGDDPISLPDGDWANQFYKLECGDGEAMAGISVDTATHRPHKILCCKLEPTFC